MSGVVEFLLARLDEDEDAARDAAGWNKAGDTRSTGEWFRVGLASVDSAEGKRVIYSDADQADGSVADYVAYYDPARVLADVAAKRRVVDLLDETSAAPYKPGNCVAVSLMTAVQTLATAYSSHPDYDKNWRP